MAMTDLKPFADDATSVTLGGLTIENGSDRLALYGTAEITRDKTGLALARQLRAIISQAVAVLEKDDLPDEIAPSAQPTAVKNPFA
jgi:hypothetical protein